MNTEEYEEILMFIESKNNNKRAYPSSFAHFPPSVRQSKKANSSPYHPQTNGQIERANKEIKKRLMQCLEEGKHDLKKELCTLLAAKNGTEHRSTKVGVVAECLYNFLQKTENIWSTSSWVWPDGKKYMYIC